MGKLPASLFYWGDFVRDPDLRRCTNAEVGVWIRLLCLMFEAEHKGVLTTRGVPWTDEEIALAVGGRFDETLACVTALVTKGVASRNEQGALMNRRMYRDEKIRQDTKERVRRHREKQDVEEVSNAQCNAVGNAKDTPCTEAETETANEVLSSIEAKSKDSSVEEQEEAIYQAYPRHVGHRSALKAIRGAVERLRLGSLQKPAVTAQEARRWLWKQAATYANSPAGKKPPGDDMRPHPATWFNDERYFDDIAEWKKSGSTGGSNGKQSRSDAVLASTQRVLADLHPATDGMGGGTFGGGRTIEAGSDPGRLYAEAAASLVATNSH